MSSQPSVSDQLTSVSWRLLGATVGMLVVTAFLFAITLWQDAGRFPVSWFCFGVGVLGGFVSIQQRLKLLSEEELAQLAHSWVHILIIPLFAGIFALVFYILTISGIVEGILFPAFAVPDFGSGPTTEDMRRFFTETYPASGEDFAKLGFWSFVAGFSERLLPDMIEGTVRRSETDGGRA